MTQEPGQAQDIVTSIPGIDEAVQRRLRASRVMVAGLGNIGSFVAPMLAPLVGCLRLVDRSRVADHNPANQLYGPRAVGEAKVDATVRRLQSAACAAQLERFPVDLRELSTDDFADVDFCLAGLDSLRARQILSEHTQPRRIPYLDGGVGDPFLLRVQVLLPGSACLECDWSERHYRQLAREYPCRPGVAAQGHRTLAPSSVGAAAAAILVAQLVRLCAGDPPHESYEISGNLAAGRMICSRRRRNPACRFSHAVPLPHPLKEGACHDVPS